MLSQPLVNPFLRKSMCEWQPMETAPKDGTRIILASDDGFVWCDCQWQKMKRVPDRWQSFVGTVPFEPIAWMPKPKYPISEEITHDHS